MIMKEPKIEFVEINFKESIIITSDTCSNCSTDNGYTGGGHICFGDMTVSTECTDAMSKALEG